MKTTVTRKGISDLVTYFDQVRLRYIKPRRTQIRFMADLVYHALVHLMIENYELKAKIEKLEGKKVRKSYIDIAEEARMECLIKQGHRPEFK